MTMFIGLLLGLLIATCIILCLPSMDPKTVNVAYLMSSFPVFLSIWSLILLYWCTGFVISMCQQNGINYRFLLGTDPRSQVSASYFFKQGAWLTCLWVALFGMYVIDYKWEVSI